MRYLAIPFIFPFLLAYLDVAAQAQTPSTLDKIKASGGIGVAYREASIPFSYLGADAQPQGFGWDICGRIVERVKQATGRPDLKVVPRMVTSQSRRSLLENGIIDIECGSTTNNTDRAKQVAFSINYFYTGTRLLVKSSSPIRSLADLAGKKVVSTAGTTNYQLLHKINSERHLDFELLSAWDHAQSALLVQQGRADAFGMDDILLQGWRANSQKPFEFAVVGEAVQIEPYAVMLRRTDPAFKKQVDDTLVGLMKSGEFESLYKKWFQSPIPPRGVNLNIPMSQELRHNLKVLSDKPLN